MNKSNLLVAIYVCILVPVSSSVSAAIIELAAGYNATSFLTLNFSSRTIEFDSSQNLYATDIADDFSGTINIFQLSPGDGYASRSVYTSYGTTMCCSSGLAFNDSNTRLFVSEVLSGGDAGIIRELDNTTLNEVSVTQLPDFRPTNVAIDNSGTVYFPGRLSSDSTFGNLYRLGLSGPEIIINGLVATSVATDSSGNIYATTAVDDVDAAPFLAKALYRFDADTLDATLIARSDLPVTGLTVDSSGNVYLIEKESPLDPTTNIVKISSAPVPTFLASGWEASDFLTLSSPTRSIAFDSSNNLYIEDISDDNSGTIKILKLDAASGYSSPPSEFVFYATSYQGVTGLDFDGLGSLYVSERSLSGDAGVIREIDVNSQTLLGDVMTFANHRPTGIDADKFGNVYYTGRKATDGSFGRVYQIDSMGVRSILIDNIVGTGIAVDASGNIFVSTPGRTDLALLSNSIYMFRSSDASLLNPVLIATFNVTGGELTFDDDGSLYMIADDKISIIKLIPADTDGDGLADYIDNCMLVSNYAQRDTDADGYGNICDPDFNNDGIVASADLAFFKPKYFTADPDADLNGDGVVGAADLAILKTMFFKPPGPSGLVP